MILKTIPMNSESKRPMFDSVKPRTTLPYTVKSKISNPVAVLAIYGNHLLPKMAMPEPTNRQTMPSQRELYSDIETSRSFFFYSILSSL